MAEGEVDEQAEKPPVRRKPARKTLSQAGPTDISDPILRREAKRALAWFGIASIIALIVILANPLLVIFGGMVFAAMIDGGARLLGRALPFGRGTCVAIILLLTAIFLVWVVVYAGSQIAQQAVELPATITSQGTRMLHWMAAHGYAVDAGSVQGFVEKVFGGVGELTRAVGGMIGFLTTIFLIIVLGIYFALEPKLYRRGLAWMIPIDQRDYFEGTALLMGKALRRLLAGRLAGMTIEGMFTFIALAVYGVPMAALLALLTGLLAFLPNIGAPISGVLMVTVGFSGGTEMGLYCIGVYVAVHMLDGNVIVPLIARRTVDLAPALVLGAQLIMGVLFGVLGLALADPLVAMIKVWLEREAARNKPVRFD